MRSRFSLGRRAHAEAVGTFLLVLVGPGAVMVNGATHGAVTNPGIALAFAFVVTAVILEFGHLSGAHINPAVTIAFVTVRRFPLREAPVYVAAQCAGAIAASEILESILGPAGNFGVTTPAYGLGIGAGTAFLLEWLMSFALMLVIIAAATDARVAHGFAAAAIGLTVGVCALVGGPLTGASMNPARSLGPAVASGDWVAHWVYWIAPLSAMIVAARLFVWLRGSALEPGQEAAMGSEGPIDVSPPSR
ncbi:MAG: aquaporin, partial [Gemmatimonadota bacterium]